MKARSSWPGIPPSVKAIAETLAHSSTHAYVARWGAAPPSAPQPSSCFELKDRILSTGHNKFDVLAK